MKTFKEFIGRQDEDMFNNLANKLIGFADNGDLKKLERMKNLDMLKKYYSTLDRSKKKDLQRLMFRKFNKMPEGKMKEFAKYVTKQRIR